MFGEFADGFVPMNSTFNVGVRTPGCVVTDDLTRELGDVNEALLATALSYRNTGSCPATVVKPGNPPVSRDPQFVPIQQTVDGRSMEGVFDSNRDMTLPER